MRNRIISFIVAIVLNLYVGTLPAGAQQSEKMPRIGVLLPSGTNPFLFIPELSDLGYVEGQNIAFEYRSADGNLNQLPDLAAELIRLPVDILVPAGIAASLAAKRATTTIPIVFFYVTDPVGRGLVASIVRPGGNITGVTFNTGLEILSKRLELLKEAVPTITHVAYVTGNTRTQSSDNQRMESEIQERTARALGLTLRYFQVQQIEEFDARVFPAIKADPHPIDALYVSGPLVNSYRWQLANFALQNRLPMIGHHERLSEAGALLSYGASLEEIMKRCAVLISKVLQGAKLGDLPVEQPTKYDFIINLRTAKQLGITIPPTVLYQATEVIQ
jgi:putative ABC transport system substrate-binding protein